jgi:hypothetical protein
MVLSDNHHDELYLYNIFLSRVPEITPHVSPFYPSFFPEFPIHHCHLNHGTFPFLNLSFHLLPLPPKAVLYPLVITIDSSLIKYLKHLVPRYLFLLIHHEDRSDRMQW